MERYFTFRPILSNTSTCYDLLDYGPGSSCAKLRKRVVVCIRMAPVLGLVRHGLRCVLPVDGRHERQHHVDARRDARRRPDVAVGHPPCLVHPVHLQALAGSLLRQCMSVYPQLSFPVISP